VIGFGTEFIRLKEKDEIYNLPDHRYDKWTQNLTHDIKSIPILLNGYFSYSMTHKMNISLFSGIGYYFSQFKNVMETDTRFADIKYSYTYETLELLTIKRDHAKGQGFGWHGRISFELDIFSGIQMIIDCKYRYVRLNDWNGQGEIILKYNNRVDTDSETAKLWYIESDDYLRFQYMGNDGSPHAS
jgi:hypothetical protein